MSIHPPNTATIEATVVHKRQNLVVFRDGQLRQFAEKVKYLGSVSKVPQRQFPQDEWVYQHLAFVEQIKETGVD